MREESHLDEMRQALRGDFERLAARRGDQELLRLSEPETPDDEPEEQPEGQRDEQQEQQEAEPARARRSWLARMFSA